MGFNVKYQKTTIITVVSSWNTTWNVFGIIMSKVFKYRKSSIIIVGAVVLLLTVNYFVLLYYQEFVYNAMENSDVALLHISGNNTPPPANHRYVLPRKLDNNKLRQRMTVDSSLSSFNYNSLALSLNSTLTDPIIHMFDNNNNKIPMIVIVLSARENRERRNIIRSTWGKNCVLYFVIGGDVTRNNGTDDRLLSNHQNEMQLLSLQTEQMQYHDLIDSIHPDSYSSLPHKLKFALNWINNNYYDVSNTSPVVSGPDWVYKLDDDCYARVQVIYESLLLHFNTKSSIINNNKQLSSNICIGKIQLDSPVYRNGKWEEDTERYPHNTYPIFALGSCGYIISRGIVQYIGKQYQHDYEYLKLQQHNRITLPGDEMEKKIRLRIYQGEDTSLGIWLEESYLIYQEKMTLFIDSTYFSNNPEDCYQMNILSIGHQLSVNDIQQCYEYEKMQMQFGIITNNESNSTSSNIISSTSATLHKEQLNHVWYIRTLAHNNNNIGKTTNNNNNGKDNATSSELWGSISRMKSKEAEALRNDRAAKRSAKRKALQFSRSD